MREWALEAIYRKYGLSPKSYFKRSWQNERNSMAIPNLQQEVDGFFVIDQEIREVKDNTIEEISRKDEELKDAVKSRTDMITVTVDFEDFKSVSLEEIGTPPILEDNIKLIFEDLQNRAREEEEKTVKKCQRVAKDFVHLLGTTKEITADAIVGYFLAAEDPKELVLILAASFIHQIKPRRRKKKRPKQVREKNKKRGRRNQLVKAGTR